MKYTKTIRRSLAVYYLMTAVFTSSVLMLCIIAFALCMKITVKPLSVLKSWGIITAVLVLCAVIKTLLVQFSLRKQIRHQDAGIDFNDEHFTQYAGYLYMGRDWLVYHKGIRYRIWNHSFVRRAAVEKKRTGTDIRILCDRGTEGIKVKKTEEDLQRLLDEWITQPDW